MAAHNAENTICEAVQSALAQDYDGPIRVLVIDDASTDRTAEMIPVHDDVDVVRNTKRLGRSGSRNRALHLVRTDLVAIHDADDVSLPNRLSTSVPLVSDSMTVVGTQLIWKDTSGELYEGAHWPTSAVEGAKVLAEGRTPIAHPSMLIPTNLIRRAEGYDERFPVAEDLDLMLRVKKLDPTIRFLNSSKATVIYSRPSCDSLTYCLRSHYWRSQVLEHHRLTASEWNLWGPRALDSYLRQRARVLRRWATKAMGKFRRNDE